MKNVTSFGAVGDFNLNTGVGTDNTSAFSAAFTSAAQTGDSVYVPNGNYLITGPVGSTSYTNGVKVYGDSPTGSILVMQGASAHLQLSGTGFGLKDLGLIPKGSAGTLVYAGYYNATYPSQVPGFGLIENCIFSFFGNLGSYSCAINAVGMTFSSIQNCSFWSPGASNVPSRQAYGVKADYSVNVRIRACNFVNFSMAVYVSSVADPHAGNTSQGIVLSENMSTFCNYGLYNVAGYYICANNNVFDYCGIQGIYTTSGQATLSGNYVAFDPASSSTNDSIGIANASAMLVYGNILTRYETNPPVSTSGIAVVGGGEMSIAANSIYHSGHGIYTNASSQAITVTANSIAQALTKSLDLNSSNTIQTANVIL